jgi:hypothetical protein
MRRTFVLVLGGAIVATAAVAQSTPTEQAAAREIMQQIDELQERLKPTERAQLEMRSLPAWRSCG